MASLLFLLCAVWAVCVPIQAAIRPSSPDEFRKLLLWAQRAADRNLKRGEPIPPYPSPDQLNEVDAEWEKSHQKSDRYDNDLITAPRPYLESSNFRSSHSFPETEPQPTDSVPNTQQSRTIADKKSASSSKKIEYNNSPRKSPNKDNNTPDEIHETISPSETANIRELWDKKSVEDPFYYTEKSRNGSHDVVVNLPNAAPKKESVDPPAEVEAVPKVRKSEEKDLPSAPPPYWSHSSLVDELTDPLNVGRLPAHEEYDRNQRYSHSFIHGFSTGF